MRKLWLIFAQTATVAVGVLFVITALKPEWLGRSATSPQVVELRQAATVSGVPARAASYSDAVRKAVPAVVNIFTSKEIKTPRHPFLDDPLFRRFFGNRLEEEPQRAASLGSGVIVSSKGYILTNHHVVEAADEIEVALADGKKLKARPSAPIRKPISRSCGSKAGSFRRSPSVKPMHCAWAMSCSPSATRSAWDRR